MASGGLLVYDIQELVIVSVLTGKEAPGSLKPETIGDKIAQGHIKPNDGAHLLVISGSPAAYGTTIGKS